MHDSIYYLAAIIFEYLLTILGTILYVTFIIRSNCNPIISGSIFHSFEVIDL